MTMTMTRADRDLPLSRQQRGAAASETLFAQFRQAMGLNRRQVAEAGEKIGLSSSVASSRHSGASEVTLTEQLAMAAVRAGLPPWSPETDAGIAKIGEIREIVDRA